MADLFAHYCQPSDDLAAELNVRDLLTRLAPFSITGRLREQNRLLSANRIRQVTVMADQRRRRLHGKPRPPHIPSQRSRTEVDAVERRVIDHLHAPTVPPKTVRTDIDNNRGGRT